MGESFLSHRPLKGIIKITEFSEKKTQKLGELPRHDFELLSNS